MLHNFAVSDSPVVHWLRFLASFITIIIIMVIMDTVQSL